MNYPLQNIAEPHSHDVLCGRGGGTNNHIGNSHWRMLVAANKQLYITLPKRQKMLLSRSIVNAVRSQNPPGRFLQKDGKTKLWNDVGDQRAQEKTSQALREGAPDIRKKVAAAKESANSSNSTAPNAAISGDTSNSGANTDGAETSQIPVHTITTYDGDRKPEPTGSSSIMPQTSGAGDGMLEPIPTPEIQQNYNLRQQQMNGMFGDHGGTGHMTLNERGMMIQNVMMHGARGFDRQNFQQMNSNDGNYNQAAYLYQQQQQQQSQMQRQMHHQQDYQQQFHYQQQQLNNNVNYQQQQQNQYQQQQQFHGNNSGSISNYDNFDAPPPEELDRDGLSFGSLHMTDAEMHKLQQGSAHNPSKNRRHSISKKRGSMGSRASDHKSKNIPGAPMGGVLEPTGISLGDVSMHSLGTMMSYNTLNTTNHTAMSADMVDGGLMDAVGTSFGSLSLDKSNRDMLFKTLEIAGGGTEVPPMFRSETKASANLLDCSDTESESSQDKQQQTRQKSQAWEMMKTRLDKQTSKTSVNSQELMPPPVGVPQNKTNENSNKHTFDSIEIALPPTTMEANFSTLSAWSAADDYNDSSPTANGGLAENAAGTGKDDGESDDEAVAAPPPELSKNDSF